MANLKNEKPGQYRPSDEDFKAGFEENMRFFQSFFLKSDNKLIAWSFDSQLQFNCQQIHCLHEIRFPFWMNRRTDVSSIIK